jgi:hypothetical protein
MVLYRYQFSLMLKNKCARASIYAYIQYMHVRGTTVGEKGNRYV